MVELWNTAALGMIRAIVVGIMFCAIPVVAILFIAAIV